MIENDPIPTGADPIWQPNSYLQGCAGWCACTGYLEGFNDQTPWLIPLHHDPFEGLRKLMELKGW